MQAHIRLAVGTNKHPWPITIWPTIYCFIWLYCDITCCTARACLWCFDWMLDSCSCTLAWVPWCLGPRCCHCVLCVALCCVHYSKKSSMVQLCFLNTRYQISFLFLVDLFVYHVYACPYGIANTEPQASFLSGKVCHYCHCTNHCQYQGATHDV